MSVEVKDALDAEQWSAYGNVYSFVGNELLTPMNRSGNVAGLSPEFWSAAPAPDSERGAHALERLSAYAQAASLADGDEDSKVPGVLNASVEFAHLFIGPPSPAASPWETTNDPRNQKKVGYGRATVAMRRLLAEEGLELSTENRQYEDHMGIELLYLSILCEKAAAACAHDDDESTRHIAEKAAWFMSAHPLAWMSRLRANVDAERPHGYYSALLEYAEAVLEDQYSSLV
jgi:TorA maturation chaperone TorD